MILGLMSCVGWVGFMLWLKLDEILEEIRKATKGKGK